MAIDSIGGMWLSNPVIIVVLSVLLAGLFGFLHALSPNQVGSDVQGDASRACDELRAIVAQVALELASSTKPHKAPMATPYATRRKSSWSHGTRRLYVGSRPERIAGWTANSRRRPEAPSAR